MGKKRGGSNGGGGDDDKAAARAFVLKVAMHCHCHGCVDRIRAAVRDLTLLQGVEAVDQSAVETSGEVRLLATADPERLRQRLRKATRKNVDLLLPKPPAPKKEVQDRLVVDQLLQPAAQYCAWPPNHHPQLLGLGGGGWNNGRFSVPAVHQAYPWATSSSSHPAAAWGPYAYAPPAQGHGAYYGGAPAWHGY